MGYYNFKNICHKFEHTESRFVALVNAKAAIFNYRQSQHQNITKYYETFKELISVLESYNGQLHDPEAAAPENAKIKEIADPKSTLFTKHESGLYLFDTNTIDNKLNNHSNESIIAYSCLQTVAHNKSKFTIRQVEAADAARKLYRLLGHPGYTRFLTALRENHILNCPITVDDARRAEQIYGKDIAFLKGKTTAKPAKAHVPDYTPVNLPPELLSLHPNVTLCFDIFYVLGLAFSLSTSQSIHYLACHHIGDRSKPTIQACISSDITLYQTRGFTPTEIHADGEYNPFRDCFPNIHFSIYSADDHVPEIERAIRTVKESIRTIIHGMPYSRLPRVLVKELTTSAVRTINMLPHPDGVSTTMSPATIVSGEHKPDYNQMPLEFGTYVQVYDGTSNDTKSRTLGAIATNPTGNTSGDYYFMSLATGSRIHRRSWTILPISDTVISCVEAIALNEAMPLVDTPTLLTEYDPEEIIDPTTYDRNYQPPNTPDPHSDHSLTSNAYTDKDSDTDDDDLDDDLGHHPDFDDITNEERTQLIPVENEERTDITPDNTHIETEAQPAQPVNNEERTIVRPINLIDTSTPPSPTGHDDITITTTNTTTHTNHRPGLRPTQPVTYQHKFGFTQTSHSGTNPHVPAPSSPSTAHPHCYPPTKHAVSTVLLLNSSMSVPALALISLVSIVVASVPLPNKTNKNSNDYYLI
jgi:hypothetical protein